MRRFWILVALTVTALTAGTAMTPTPAVRSTVFREVRTP